MLPVERACEAETTDIESAGDGGAVTTGYVVGDLTAVVDSPDALNSAHARNDHVA